LPVKEALLMEVCSMFVRYSTEPVEAELLMKSTPAMERGLRHAQTTPPFCGCEERAGVRQPWPSLSLAPPP